MYCVIMAGGSGTRFWPRSREEKSKQFLSIQGKKSLIQSTVERISPFASGEHVYVVSKKSQKKELESHIKTIPSKNFIYEPEGKNTAPCIGLATLHIQKRNAEAVIIVLPSDHLIGDKKIFKKTIMAGVQLARERNGFVTLGIKPDRPATGYGYVQQGEAVPCKSNIDAYNVKAFAEKPDEATAKRFLESGDFLWNSGMFIFRVSVFMQALEELLPELYDGLMEIKKSIGKVNYDQVVQRVYKQIRSISIDYGIMEKAKNVYLLKADFSWNDLGSWEQVYQLARKDAHGNAIEGKAICIDTKNSYIYNSEGLVACIGLEDVVIVHDQGAILVCKRDKVEDVKKAVEVLKRKKHQEYL